MTPRWLETTTVRQLHSEQIEIHGGLPGEKSEASVEAALARPKQLHAYAPDSSIPRLAAAYGYGLCQIHHPFNDGNKRIAVLSIYVFLADNGFELEADPSDLVETIQSLAAGTLSEEALTAWIEVHSNPT